MSARRTGTVFWAAALLASMLLGAPQAASAATVRATQAGDVRVAAAIVVRALRQKDGAALAAIAHPAKGVRFSPSAYVDRATDVVLWRAALRRLWAERRALKWGHAEGSGDPIELTPARYVARYTLPPRPLKPDAISVNRDRAHDNTTNNAAFAYPRATRVEYFWRTLSSKGDPAFDWLALRLVFEPVSGRWLLVGVIQDRWST